MELAIAGDELENLGKRKASPTPAARRLRQRLSPEGYEDWGSLARSLNASPVIIVFILSSINMMGLINKLMDRLPICRCRSASIAEGYHMALNTKYGDWYPTSGFLQSMFLWRC